jgi:phage baseplate assembly protein W
MSRAISLPFSFDTGGSLSFTEDERKIWQDRVVIAVMTQLGERAMRPGFGTEIKQGLFANREDAVYIIKNGITKAFSTWLNSLTLLDIKYTFDSNEILNFEIFYALNVTLKDSVTITTAILSRAGELLVEVTNG